MIRTGTTLLVWLAAGPAMAADPCPAVADAWTLARCAATRSELVLRARHELQAARGRQRAAEHLVPANPTLELSGGPRRAESGATDLDRGVELSQSFEIAGQRGARLSVADAELRAATARVADAERQVTIDVLAAAVEVERARLAAGFAAEQRALAERLVAVSTGRAREEVGTPLDVELAEAARVQAHREELSAGRAFSEAHARLALATGAQVSLVEGSPVTVAAPDRPLAELVQQAVERRMLVREARAEVLAGTGRLSLLRRERIPDVTLGAGYRHEEFSDVAGLRLSVPLPLFRRNQGEIMEQQALVERAGAAEGQARLRVSVEVEAAHAAWLRARALARQISADLEPRLAGDARALREAYERGTMPLTTALAGLREVYGARRTVADGRAEATLATLELLTATAGTVTPEVSP